MTKKKTILATSQICLQTLNKAQITHPVLVLVLLVWTFDLEIHRYIKQTIIYASSAFAFPVQYWHFAYPKLKDLCMA